MRARVGGAAGAMLLLALLAPVGAGAQSVLGRPPDLTGAWTASRGVLQFNLVHRFDVSPAPARKVTNSPTLLVGYGVREGLMLGFDYATASDLVAGYPNEWEFFGRWLPVRQEQGRPVDVSLQGGYNLATESVDAELLLARAFGAVRLFAAGRALSNGLGSDDEARFAAAGGAVVRLRDGLSVSGDLAGLVDRESGEDLAWGAGVEIGVPYTPHTLSLHATTVNTQTLAGSSVGSGTTRWGFEYTIPITLRRYLPAGDGSSDGNDGAMMAEAGDTVEVAIDDLAYGTPELRVRPGTTVRWTNRDPLQHTVTSDDDVFDSGLIDPDGSWTWTFDSPGEYAYHCIPHPFMKGRVVVLESEGGGP